MCRAVKCRTCGKMTWAGCGLHVEQVLGGVPDRDRCQGHPESAKSEGSLFSRVFRRR